MTGRRPAACLLSALAIVLSASGMAGCGGTDETDGRSGETEPTQAQVEPQELSPAGVKTIQRARDEVSAHCRSVDQALDGGTGPTPTDMQRVNAALDELAELAAAEPGAEMVDGTTPRLALGDIAENLEGTNCDPRLVARIDEALADLPAD
jgi:hypothetical protein